MRNSIVIFALKFGAFFDFFYWIVSGSLPINVEKKLARYMGRRFALFHSFVCFLNFGKHFSFVFLVVVEAQEDDTLPDNCSYDASLRTSLSFFLWF